MNFRSILVQPGRFKVGCAVIAARLLEVRARLIAQGRGNDHGNIIAHDFGRGVAEHALRAVVPAGDRALQRDPDDCVIGRPDDLRQRLIFHPRQNFTDTRAFLLEHGRYRRPQARQPVLEKIIRRAVAHELGGQLFADGAGDQYEGDVESTRLEQFERMRAAESRQPVIAQDHVRFGRECGEEIGFGRDHARLHLKTRSAQLRKHDFCVVGIILDQQKIKGCGHGEFR